MAGQPVPRPEPSGAHRARDHRRGLRLCDPGSIHRGGGPVFKRGLDRCAYFVQGGLQRGACRADRSVPVWVPHNRNGLRFPPLGCGVNLI